MVDCVDRASLPQSESESRPLSIATGRAASGFCDPGAEDPSAGAVGYITDSAMDESLDVVAPRAAVPGSS